MYLGYSNPVPTSSLAPLPRTRRQAYAGPLAKLTMVARLIAVWRRRARQRADLRRLCELDERTLRDIGLGPDDVRREMCKPFWK